MIKVATWDEIETQRLAEVIERQPLHRRLVAAWVAGEEPDSADAAAAAELNASPFRHFDRVNARDDY